MSVEMTAKGRIKRDFINRLVTAGLRRPKACKTDTDFDQMMGRLADYLTYMSPTSLEVLADQVLTVAAGKGRDEWPSELLIRQMAEALERRPPEELPIVTSWLASIEGPQALQAGHAVEMYRFLRRLGRPLLPYDRTEIIKTAERNNHDRVMILERRRLGTARPDDNVWMDRYEADLRAVTAIIERGEAARREKAMAGEEQ